MFRLGRRIESLLAQLAANSQPLCSFTEMGAQMVEDMFLSCLDCFIAPLSATKSSNGVNPRTALSRAIAVIWGVSAQRLEFFHSMYKPTLQVSDLLTVGRINLKRNAQISNKMVNSVSMFSLTKHSLRNVERVAACVSLGEPVLLGAFNFYDHYYQNDLSIFF